jgi:hypothetical protein
MARAKRTTSDADIDWYLISIDRLKQIGAVILLLLLGLGGWFWYSRNARDPRAQAERAVNDAQTALNELASSKDFASYPSEFERGTAKLEEARQLFAKQSYPEAESAAVESQTIVKSALSRTAGDRESDAQFTTVEGEVQYQKSTNSSEWRRAEVRTPLTNGDWVKTGANASAELLFSNGSLYTIGPNALLEVYTSVNPQTSKKQNTVQMRVGSVEINTSDDSSTVRTPGTQVVINRSSTARVGVDRAAETTQIVNLRGSSQVTPKDGGAAVSVESGQQVEATKEGALSPVTKALLAPALVAPADNYSYALSGGGTNVEMVWGTAPEAVAYQLQVSRSRLFSELEIDSRQNDTRAMARLTSSGVFYWRVASIGSGGNIGPFSAFRRFRAQGVAGPQGSQPAPSSDKTAPALQLKRPFNIGGQYYMIEGKVEPGATVLVNDEQIEVESDGAFRKLVSFDKLGWNKVVVKAIDAAGNQTVQSENVHVEE